MTPCRHCGTPGEAEFCCPGCAAVYAVVHQLGLQDYYRFRDAGGPVDNQSQEVALDLEQVRSLNVQGAFHCILDGLHCPACAWLIERALAGICPVQVNFSSQRLRLYTQDPQLLLQAVRAVQSLGYRALPYDPRRQERPRQHSDRLLLLRLGVAACAAGNVMLAALALYSGADEDPQYRNLFHQVSLLVSLPVVGFSAWPFWSGAAAALRQRMITTDVSIALGLLVTFVYSVGATLFGGEHIYFDTVTTFVFVLLLGRQLENSARSRAGASVERLLALQTRSAWRWDGAGYSEVAVDRLQVGDRVRVAPGGRVPADGQIVGGASYLDEAHLTGESQPRAVAAGDTVYAGSLTVDGELEVVLMQTGSTSLLSQVARLIEEAGSRPARIERVVDRLARYILPAVVGLAGLTWWSSGSWQHAVAVLIITCPCALGIATPLVVSLAAAVGVRQGVLYRDGVALENARQLTHLMVDKTGTLTRGELELVNLSEEATPWLQAAASLESRCSHPLAHAFRRAWNGPLLEVEELQQVAGRGLVGRVAGRVMRLGRADFIGCVDDAAGTAVWLEVEGERVARFDFADQLRPEAAEFLAEFRARGVRLCLASGDRASVVESCARQLDIEDFRAQCVPEDKQRWVSELQSQGAVVGFLGDGVNDAPALRQADLGLCVANGSELSWEVADVVLLRPGLGPARMAFELAQASWTRLRLNLGLALLYNALAIPSAALGWVTPLAAAIAMPLSSLAVLANSLYLLRFEGGSSTSTLRKES